VKKTFLLLLAMGLSFGVPAQAAFNGNAFDACIEKCIKYHNILEGVDSGGMSGNEARSGLFAAEEQLDGLVKTLENRREISQAKKAAGAWLNQGGTEATPLIKAAKKALKLINEREKELAAGNIFYINAFTACIEECARHIDILESTDSAGMGGDSARAGLDHAESRLRQIVATISSPKDVARARKVAGVFIKRGGTEATALSKAGKLALKYVDDRSRHLNIFKD
jgi:hypothetical protein